MHVNAKSRVVRQVPTHVIWIIVNDNLVATPVPARAKSYICRSDTEIEAVKPEARGSTPRQVPHMSRPKATREVPVRPRMIQVVVGVSRPAMSYPMIIGRVHVRCIWMSCRIVKIRLRCCPMWLSSMGFSSRRRPVRRNMSTAYFAVWRAAAVVISTLPSGSLQKKWNRTNH